MLSCKAEFAKKLYDEVAEKLFSLVVQKRQYKNYLNHLRVFPVPACLPVYTINSDGTTEPSFIDSDRLGVFDMRYYCELMDSIPPEYISVPLIVTSMVEQVTSAFGLIRNPVSI